MTTFKYRLDKSSHIITWSVLGAVSLTIALLWIFSPGGYLPAWFTSIALAVGGLLLLSAPRSIRLTDEALEIRCVVEITHITYPHIKSVERVEYSSLRPFIPLFASLGVGGYFGYWFDVRGRELVKVYASSRGNLVLIEDIYEQKYLVSCEKRDELIDRIDKKTRNL